MDFLDNILNSMQGPPSASEAQKNAVKKQKEAIERKQKEERNLINKFRKKVEDKIYNFIKDGTKPSMQFEPMDQMYRSIIRDVAEIAGVQVFSFGQEGVDRYSVVYLKDNGPSDDELSVRRSGGVWDEKKAAEMALHHLAMQKQAALDNEEEKNRKRKRGKEELSGTFYKQKYAHLIGEDAALDAAQKTNMNKSYGEVPSANKKDLRSIEQTMADIKAKKMKKAESDKVSQQPGQQHRSLPSGLVQNRMVSTEETGRGSMPWKSRRSSAGNQARSSSSIIGMPKYLQIKTDFIYGCGTRRYDRPQLLQ